MERLSELAARRSGAQSAERQRRCLRCGHPVPDWPRGCKGGHCENCRYPHPLGDCSD